MYTILFVFYIITSTSATSNSQQIGQYKSLEECTQAARQLVKHRDTRYTDSMPAFTTNAEATCVWTGLKP